MQQGNLMGNSDPNRACNLALCLIEQARYVNAEGVLIDMLSGRYQAQDHEDGKITKSESGEGTTRVTTMTTGWRTRCWPCWTW
jgi:hypothetical protein